MLRHSFRRVISRETGTVSRSLARYPGRSLRAEVLFAQRNRPGGLVMIAQDQSTNVQDRRLSSSVEQSMLAMVPRLRAFAVALCGNADRADDLVQETLLRAI